MVVDRAWREDTGIVERGRADDEEWEYRLFACREAADTQEQIKGQSHKAEGPGDQGDGFACSWRSGHRGDHRMMAAIGASTSLDQCINSPPTVPMRY